MVGHKVSLNIDHALELANPQPRLMAAGLTCKDGEGITKPDNVGFIAYGGETGIAAGQAGRNRKELRKMIAGSPSCEQRLHHLFLSGRKFGRTSRKISDGTKMPVLHLRSQSRRTDWAWDLSAAWA